MASSGKKGKKSKGRTIALTDFLADTSPPGRVVSHKSSNWADEVENDDDFRGESRKEKVILPPGPRSTWGSEVDDNKIPKNPPFLAYISNLPYEVDEEEIAVFFKDLKIVNVRVPRDDHSSVKKAKGFGYVEFDNRTCLISALSMTDTFIKNRRVRIDVAENSDNDRRRGRDMMRGDMMGRDRQDGPDRTLGDWRSGPRDEPPPDSDRDRGGGFRDRDGSGFRDRDGGGFRDRDGGGFRERDGGFDRGGRSGGRRDFGSGGFRESFGDRERGGGFRENRDGFGDRDRGRFGDRDGFDRSGGGSFSDRDRRSDRDFGGGSAGGRDFGGPRRNYSDFGGGGGGSGAGGFRGRDDGPPERGEDTEPKSRPRLTLTPRTKPIEEIKVAEPTAPPPASSGVSASIFGGARPVDTAAREREIEERLAREKGEVPRSLSREERGDDVRSKSGSEHGDRDDDVTHAPPSRRMEAAPPPSENYWMQRTQQSQNDGSEGNGHISPPGGENLERRYQERPESPRRGTEADYDDRNRSRGPQRGAYERDDRGMRDDRARDDRSGRDDRGVRDDRVVRDDRERGAPPPRGAGGGGSSTTSTRGGDRQRGRGEGRPMSERDQRGDITDDPNRMPKYREHETPNFAASNKFAYLHSDDEQNNGSD